MEMLSRIEARLEVVEETQIRGWHVEDVCADEEEEVVGEHGENIPTNDLDEERFIRALTRENIRSYFNPLDYDDKRLRWIAGLDHRDGKVFWFWKHH